MDPAVSEFFNELRPRVVGDLRADLYTRTLYSTDASLYQVMPHGVLIPKHADDMQAAIELAARRKLPLLPRAGGSSLAGQSVNAALVIDTSRWLDQVLELNVEESWVRVQPGIVLDVLNARLKVHGLQFGPDPASSNRACVGGIVSNNATGSHSILYGMAVDHVLEIKALLDDGSPVHFRPLDEQELRQKLLHAGREGEIYRRVAALVRDEDNRQIIRRGAPRHWRRCGGYNLARFIHDGSIDHYLPQDARFNLVNLLAGAEGTLAAITEVKLKLVERPKLTALAIIEFPSLQASLEVTPEILATNPTAIELIDDLSLRMAAENRDAARLVNSFLRGHPFCFFAVEYQGETESELRSKLQSLLARFPHLPITPLYDPMLQANVWAVRKIGLGLLMSMRSDWKPIPFIEDTAVPPQHLAAYIPKIEAFCNELGTQMTYYAHASAGCLHIRPLINANWAPRSTRCMRSANLWPTCWVITAGRCRASTATAACAVGWPSASTGRNFTLCSKRSRPPSTRTTSSTPATSSMRRRRIVDLRYGADYQTIPLAPALHWPAGFAAEVEMCNGAGVCRKLTTGAMCPSFMATREEEHSTRGRANLLRAALSGRLPVAELTSPRMYAALELCVSCKACKAECPSSVDMARIKTEFLAHYYAEHPRRKRDYLFAHIDLLSKLGSGWRAPIANWTLSLGMTKSLLDRWFGISKARSLPHFNRHPVTAKSFNAEVQGERGRQGEGGDKGERRGDLLHNSQCIIHDSSIHTADAAPLLFVDTYNAYSYPHVARAAITVLQAAGLGVEIAPVTDAGRPALSKGMIELARKQARRVVAALHPYAAAGRPIVFLEPSDWSAVVDDYAALLPDDARLPVVAAACVTFEQFIAASALPLSFAAQPATALLHGHCHQKALLGTQPAVQALALAGYAVREIDSTCCGMAGAFGYEKEHVEVSLKMAEHGLLPAVRAADAKTVIVAAGVSCRQQILSATGRQALHPAEALA
ncbi:MAG: FAD-binding oxidoreductase, partial [Anaerolineales bacterium]|nr:FAD-binding oxidoreductase [Anaerolineales bacterium]